MTYIETLTSAPLQMDSSWQTSALNVYRSSFLAYCSVLIARLLSYHLSINVLSIRIHHIFVIPSISICVIVVPLEGDIVILLPASCWLRSVVTWIVTESG